VVLGLFIINDFSVITTFDATVSLFISLLSEGWILKTLAFAILVGSVMELIEKSGGVGGFIEYLHKKKTFVNSPRSALLLSYFIGVVIFIESSITSLIAGAVGKPLCDKYKIPHAKLAFVCDSTSAPICSLIVLNGWGALLLGLISTQITLGMITGNSIDILIESVLYNFYAMSALVVTFLAVWFNIDIGPMKRVKFTTQKQKMSLVKGASLFYMLLPILIMVVSVFVFLYLTGDGDILRGSGSSSIFYTMLTTLSFTFVYFIATKNMTFSMWGKNVFVGGKKLFSIAMILLFAFAIGKVTVELKTGLYLASLAHESLSIYLLAGVIFLLSSAMAWRNAPSGLPGPGTRRCCRPPPDILPLFRSERRHCASSI